MPDALVSRPVGGRPLNVCTAPPVAFDTLSLDPRLLRAIGDLGFTQTTPVQSAVFPAIAAGLLPAEAFGEGGKWRLYDPLPGPALPPSPSALPP